MKRIKAALQNQDGSSLIVAIIVLLVAAALGGVVISAASVNMDRAARDREEQAYLLAESTALVFRELLESQELTILKAEDGTIEVQAVSTGDFGKMVLEDVQNILGLNGAAPLEKAEHVLDLTGEAALGDQQVQIAYTMNSGYGIELAIEVLDKGAVKTRLLAEFPAVMSTNQDETILKWSRGAITRMETKIEGGAG